MMKRSRKSERTLNSFDVGVPSTRQRTGQHCPRRLTSRGPIHAGQNIQVSRNSLAVAIKIGVDDHSTVCETTAATERRVLRAAVKNDNNAFGESPWSQSSWLRQPWTHQN